MEADTKKSTKVRLQELKCSALYCDRGDRGARYKTPKLEVGQAFVLLMNHVDTVHPLPAPPTSSSYQTLTDSVKLPAVPSIAAMDTYGLLTKSLPGEVRIKSSAEAASKSATSQAGIQIDEITAQQEFLKYAVEAEALVTSDNADRQAKKAEQLLPAKTMLEKQVAKSSAEATSQSEPRCRDAKYAADHEAICTNSQVGNKFDKSTALPELIKSAVEVVQLVTSDVDRQAKKAAEKARQRAAKY